MANPLGGQIGYNIWNVPENGDKPTNLGSVGHASSLDNAAAAEVRSSFTKFDLSGNSIDIDYYQATASFWRQAFANQPDETPVHSHISMGVNLGPNDIGGVVLTVYNAFGQEVYTGIDFVFSDGARQTFSDEDFKMLESMDDDFVTSMNKYGRVNEADWSYPIVAGVKGNTFVAGLSGFAIDISTGTFKDLHYTMQWGFL